MILWLGFDFNGLYGQDSHEYLRYSRALKEMSSSGIDPGDFFWPKLFPVFGAIFSFSGISINVSLQLISLGSILGAFYFFQRVLQKLYSNSGTWFLLLAAATQVYFIRSGLFVMSDALATFWLMGLLLFYLKFRETRELKFFLYIIGFSVAAIFTRYAAMPLIAIPLLHAAWMLISKWSLAVRIVLISVFVASGLTLLFINNQAIELIGGFATSWDVRHLFQRNFIYDSYPQSYWVPNGLYILSNFAHVGFVSFGILLVFWWRQWNFQLRFIWIGVLVYLVFLGGIGFQNQRFMVISHLWVLVLLFPSFVSLQHWLRERKIWAVFVACVLLFNSAFFYYSFSKLFAMHSLEKEISFAVNELDDNPTIYAFYITPSLKSYNVPNPTIDLWEDNLTFEKGSYVVFNVEQFGTTERVMRNWRKLEKEFNLEIIDELPENWKIYRIQ